MGKQAKLLYPRKVKQLRLTNKIKAEIMKMSKLNIAAVPHMMFKHGMNNDSSQCLFTVIYNHCA